MLLKLRNSLCEGNFLKLKRQEEVWTRPPTTARTAPRRHTVLCLINIQHGMDMLNIPFKKIAKKQVIDFRFIRGST